MTRRKLVLLMAIPVAVLLALWAATIVPPVWWSPPNPSDQVVADLAQQMEAGLIEQFHLIREDDSPWSIRIRQQEINAWLSARLPRWVAHHRDDAWPDDVGPVQVDLREGELMLGVRHDGMPLPRVAAATIAPQLAADRLRLAIGGCRMGLLPLPRAWALNGLDDAIGMSRGKPKPGAAVDLAMMVLTGGAAEPIVTLTDRRRVIVTNIHIQSGELILTCRTLPREESGRAEKQD